MDAEERQFNESIGELKEIGRRMGIKWTKAAIEEASDNLHMNQQIFVLKQACITFLAQELFNILESKLDTTDGYMKSLFSEILQMIDDFDVNDMDYTKPPSSPAN